MTVEPARTNRRVVIIGAGLAGLGCAVDLESRGIGTLVLEASDAAGGRVRTDAADGYRFDRGFQVLLTAYPEARLLLDYTALRLRPFFPGALIRADGRFRPLADPWRAPVAAVRGVLAGTVPPADALRIARFRWRVTSARRDPQPIGNRRSASDRLAAEGFTPATVKRFFRPFFGGVFLDPELVTSERQLEFVFRMFAAGAIAVPSLGMGEIPAQLAARLAPGTLRTRSPVAAVEGTEVVLEDGERINADAVVIAVDGSTARTLAGLPAAPRWRSTTCLYFAAPTPPVAGPMLVLNGEGTGPINNLCVPSEVSPDYAPEGRSLISVTVLGHHPSDDTLVAEVKDQLVAWFGDSARSWRHLRSYSIQRALPAYEEPIKPTQEPHIRDGVFVCGDHWADPSINGAFASGRRAADAISRRLNGATP
jgi:phytoene dehydrogenase-like protein